MKKIGIGLMALVAVVLAAGTVIERLHPESRIYGEWWFVALMAAVAVAAMVAVVKGKMWQRPSLLLTYMAIPVILLGGGLTTWTGVHGSMTLAPGVASATYMDEGGRQYALPFELTLESFEVVPYPGTQSPMDFVSHLKAGDERVDISMNHIYRRDGFRFYQEDYDEEGGSTLSVAHDPLGIAVTYVGYGLLMAGLIGLLLSPRGRFRRLVKGGVVVLLLGAAMPAGATPRTLPKATASKMGEMYVLYKGRVCPVQTLAKDFTTKLTGQASYKGLTPEQVLGGWLFYFSEWQEEPMMKVKGAEVKQLLGVEGRRASYADFMSSTGEYPVAEALKTMSPMDKRAKNLRAADEKYNLVQMLQGGKLLKIFPLAGEGGQMGWYSQSDALPATVGDDEYIFIRKQLSYCQELVVKGDFAELERVFEKTRSYQEQHAAGVLPSATTVGAERVYNSLTAGRWLPMLSITLGLLFFAASIATLRRPKRWLKTVGLVWVAVLSAFLLLIFVLRWIAGGHAPMAGGFDSMNLMAIAIGVITLLVSRRHAVAPAIGMLTMGFCLLVAMMSGSNPPVTHLMPVLSSPLLTLHVTVIMISYALFFFVMMVGVAGLVAGKQAEHLQRVSLTMLYPAVTLLAGGIIIGALWANISWGNYWSWDPKEVWALITLIVYSIPLHTASARHTTRFHLYCVLAFCSVIITYFGVNFILGGIHAYN